MRRQFRLPTPNFGVKEIEQYLGAREAFEKLIQDTVDRHGSEICSRPDPLLSEISNGHLLSTGRLCCLLRLSNPAQVDPSVTRKTP